MSLGASGSTKWCPRTQKSHPGTSKCTCQASEKLSQVAKMEPRVYQIVNQLLARWRGVNNWIYIYIYIHIYIYKLATVGPHRPLLARCVVPYWPLVQVAPCPGQLLTMSRSCALQPSHLPACTHKLEEQTSNRHQVDNIAAAVIPQGNNRGQ